MVKRFHLALRLAQFGRRGEALADGLSIFLASQTEVRAMTRLAGLMAPAIGFSAAAFDRRNRAAAKIAELKNARQNVGASLFERVNGIWQRASPIRTYAYVRIIRPKKRKLLTPTVHVAHPLITAAVSVAATERLRAA